MNSISLLLLRVSPNTIYLRFFRTLLPFSMILCNFRRQYSSSGQQWCSSSGAFRGLAFSASPSSTETEISVPHLLLDFSQSALQEYKSRLAQSIVTRHRNYSCCWIGRELMSSKEDEDSRRPQLSRKMTEKGNTTNFEETWIFLQTERDPV